MRKRFLILFLLVSAVVYGQTPAGYIKANMRFKWTAGIFDSALHVPQYSGTPSGTRNGAWVGDGAIGMDTTNHRMYIYSGGAWLRLASYAEAMNSWSLTGNAGTNTSTNFIGTTDAQPLMFRYNNLNAGSIGKSSGGTYLGIGAGENDNAEDEPNVGVGYYALYYNTTGSGNSAVGDDALYNNTTGYYNSVVGIAALASNTTGSKNSAVGASAGNNANQKVDAKNQILIGANTYGTRDSIAVIGASFMKETILRGNLIDSTLSAGAGTKAVRWNSSTGEFTYADTTAGGGGGLTIGTTTIANSATGSILYDSSGILSRNADLYWDVSNKRLGIGTSTPTALTHLISTTEQLRIGYDASNYYKTTVGSTGGVTFDAVGSGSQFSFSDNVNVTGTGNVFYGRWKARVDSTTSSATPTINTDNVDLFKITALAAAITSMTTNLSGTPNDGDILELVITDNGTARAITWGASFVSTTVTLPSTTTLGVTLTVVLQYYKSSSYGNNKWHCVNYY